MIYIYEIKHGSRRWVCLRLITSHCEGLGRGGLGKACLVLQEGERTVHLITLYIASFLHYRIEFFYVIV